MEAQQLWQAVLGDLEVRLSKTAFNNWLRPTRVVAFNDDTVTVAAANTFGAATLQGRYAAQIERAVSDLVGRPIKVEFTIAERSDPPPAYAARTVGARGGGVSTQTDPGPSPSGDAHPSAEPATPRDRPQPATPNAPIARPAPDRAQPARPPAAASQQLALAATPNHCLNPRYVYERYIVGSSNRFAHAASLSVAENPGGIYNPFFVYGGVGLGKTHLVHAIGHRAIALRPDIVIVYVSSEKFTNDLINAIRGQRMEDFRSRYRAADILMIDDIQFIAGKESTQEEFFHTFNALYQAGKQVVITSDRSPKAIASLADRLRSRFEGGLIADVGMPDFETRTAILRTKGETMGVALPDAVVEYVAQKDQTNIRELEGALNRILALAQLTGRSLTLALAMEALTGAGGGAAGPRPKASAVAVVEAVAAYYKVHLKDLRGRGRTKEIVLPRQVAMYLVREETSLSLGDIGQELGGRDHTTVMHGIEKIEQALTADAALRSQVVAIREAIFTGT